MTDLKKTEAGGVIVTEAGAKRRKDEIRRANIAQIVEVSGLDEEIVKSAVLRANQLGLSSASFLKYECWNKSEVEIRQLVIELKTKRAKTNAVKPKTSLQKVCEATGWSRDKAKEILAKAKSVGMQETDYVRYSCWDLTLGEIKEFCSILERMKEIRVEEQEWYVDTVCQKTGMKREKAIEDMERCRKMGITAVKYLQKECYNKNQLERERLCKILKRESGRISDNKIQYVKKVCDATGWKPGKAELEIMKAKVVSGASYEDYFVFKMFNLTPEEQKKYVTFGLFSKMRLKYNYHENGRKYFDDKAMFNQTFADCINRRWFVNKNLSYKEFLKNIDGLDAVLVKPLTATQGIGIQKFNCNVSDKRALYDQIMNLPSSIIEQYIVQHEDVMKFCDTSVNTLRITTLNHNGECKFLYSVFRMGQGKVVDNFHAGGIAASVDMNSGIVITHAADLDANVYPTNPYSGLAMKGFKIPHWEKIIETCKKAYNKVDKVNLIGWDFAITPDGVDLIEGNPGASYVVAQIPFVQDEIGIRDVMVDPYL